MNLQKCSMDDVKKLAILNKQLIEDEQSDNNMSIVELEERMHEFLNHDYDAYYFTNNNDIIGYALINKTKTPMYLRQFLIQREFRNKSYGRKAFAVILEELGISEIDLEVLSWNKSGVSFWESCGFQERSKYMKFKK